MPTAGCVFATVLDNATAKEVYTSSRYYFRTIRPTFSETVCMEIYSQGFEVVKTGFIVWNTLISRSSNFKTNQPHAYQQSEKYFQDT